MSPERWGYQRALVADFKLPTTRRPCRLGASAYMKVAWVARPCIAISTLSRIETLPALGGGLLALKGLQEMLEQRWLKSAG